jgi:XTP/dITP diphosphohydrolase
MKKIVFATNNQHKLQEVKEVLGDAIEIVSLAELNCFDDIPETANTLEGNALIKAEYIYNKFSLNCFADDTGLEVEALDGAPGVYSARYAGEENNAIANMEKLLANMSVQTNKNARFRTVIAYIEQGKIQYFEGMIEGKIATEPKGKAGFGYDPVFIPNGYQQSFAELGADEKNKISHRALAVNKFAQFLLNT